MVDAATGYHDNAPGRMSAIYTAGLMAWNREEGETDVFEGYLTELLSNTLHYPKSQGSPFVHRGFILCPFFFCLYFFFLPQFLFCHRSIIYLRELELGFSFHVYFLLLQIFYWMNYTTENY